MEFLLKYLKIEVKISSSSFSKNKVENKIAIYFGIFITIFCIVDLLIRGPLLFTNPSKYDTLSSTETYIRYITIMCWSLIPISFFCTENKPIKTIFFITAILFPILVVDRNRFLSSMYAFSVVFIVLNKEKMKKENFVKFLKRITFFLILISTCSLMIFSFVGEKRSSIETLLFYQKKITKPLIDKDKYDKLKNINEKDMQKLNIKGYIDNMPTPLKWLLIYSSASVFNFAAIQNIDYRDTDYLNYQLFRFFRHDIPVNRKELTPKPIPFPPLSACTEFFPFFLYGGATFVMYAFLLIGIIYFTFLNRLSKFPSSIFLLLGFLKMSYCCITLSFGTQFFRLTNLVFLVLMIFMHKIANSRLLDPLLTSKGALMDRTKPTDSGVHE
ncbi:MAG: hypothetical protein JNK42_06305 [Caedimonas sp.]|nr:hypothetical protein [Caedimonas sp.]